MTEVEGQTQEIAGVPPNSAQEESSLPTPPSDPYLPPSSLSDSGQSKRPRDARLFHMVLASYGVTAYQERVPLQLMDFAYRYTSSTLSDALHFSTEAYGHTTSNSNLGVGKNATTSALSEITTAALRLSIHSRTHYQYNPVLPTAVYTEIAQERNRVALPPLRNETGLMLPPEQYCLTANGFDMEEEEEEEDAEETLDDDIVMKNDEVNGNNDEGIETEGGKMEDLFGNHLNGAVTEDEMEED